MRAGWAGLVLLVLAGCIDTLNADLNADVDIDGDGEPGEPVTIRPPADEPVKAAADAEPEPEPVDVEPDAGEADAGPLALFDTPCTDHAVCAELDPVGGVCWELHTEPGRFPHDMFGHCTFACGQFVETEAQNGSPTLEWQDAPERVATCWAMGGVCDRIGQEARHCVPAAD